MIRRCFYFLLLISTIILAQQEFEFEFDYAEFRFDSTSNLVEIYYKFNPADFETRFVNNEEIISQSIIIQFSLPGTNEISVSDTIDNVYKSVDIKNSDNFKDILGIYNAILAEGNYELNLTIKDNFSGKEFSSKEFIIVKAFGTDEPSISDIQLANSISKDTTSSDLFTKNTLKVIPNTTSSYSSDLPLLLYYCELYNIAGKDIQLTTAILEGQSKVVYSSTKGIKQSNESIVQVDQINLLKYPSGIYTIKLIISDSLNTYAYESEKQFYFYNKLYTKNQETDSGEQIENFTSPFAFMSIEECNEVFDQSKYIASEHEKELWDKLTTIEAKREFLTQFWKRRSDDKNGNWIQSYDYYKTLIKEVRTKFSSGNTTGEKTERGRVYLSYGPPSRVERYPNESNLRPYEIWYYDGIESGVIFIFGDLTGFSNYELIHSTKRGEIYDDTWQRRLYIK